VSACHELRNIGLQRCSILAVTFSHLTFSNSRLLFADFCAR